MSRNCSPLKLRFTLDSFKSLGLLNFVGSFTDTVSIGGNRRRPYFIIAGVVGAMSMIILSIQNLYLVYELLLLIGGSLGVAVADVTIDACVIENSISRPLAGDMQSLCGFSSSVGQLIGFTISGFLVHIIGSKEMVGSISAVGAVGSLLGVLLYQNAFRTHPFREIPTRRGKAWSRRECFGVDNAVRGDVPEISFGPLDLQGISLPHNDVLVIGAKVANYDMSRVFVNSGNSVNVIFQEALDQMNLEGYKLEPVETVLYGFAGHTVYPKEEIVLPLTVGAGDLRKTSMTTFNVVNALSSYNIILGRLSSFSHDWSSSGCFFLY